MKELTPQEIFIASLAFAVGTLFGVLMGAVLWV